MSHNELSFSSLGTFLSVDEVFQEGGAEDTEIIKIENGLFGWQFSEIVKKTRLSLTEIFGCSEKKELLMKLAIVLMIPKDSLSSDFSNSKSEIRGKDSYKKINQAVKILTGGSRILKTFKPLTENPLFGESFSEMLEEFRSSQRKIGKHYWLIFAYKKYLIDPSRLIHEIKSQFPKHDLKLLLNCYVNDLENSFPQSECRIRFERIWVNYLKYESAKKKKLTTKRPRQKI